MISEKPCKVTHYYCQTLIRTFDVLFCLETSVFSVFHKLFYLFHQAFWREQMRKEQPDYNGFVVLNVGGYLQHPVNKSAKVRQI